MSESMRVSVSVNMSVGQEAPHLESIGHFEHVLERYGPCLALRRLLLLLRPTLGVGLCKTVHRGKGRVDPHRLCYA
jgi:hypothetical protein